MSCGFFPLPLKMKEDQRQKARFQNILGVMEEYVRGDLFLSGWHAKLIDIEKKISKVHYIVHTNIKGSLPNWVGE